MKIEQFFKHTQLIPFYSSRGIELNDEFENKPEFSYILSEGDEFIAAITCSKIDSIYTIEAIAVKQQYERRKYGTKLLQYVIKIIQSLGSNKVYLNAKNTEFFVKNGFIVIKNDDVPEDLYSYCYNCQNYNKKCFPKTMRFQY